jgi:uncharacterized membrane protein
VFFISPIKNKTSISWATYATLIIAALFRAGMALFYKQATLEEINIYQLLILNGAIWVICGAIYTIAFERKSCPSFVTVHWKYGIASGLLCCGIVLFLAKGLEAGEASIVVPISQLGFIGTAILGVLVIKEELTMRKCIAFSMGILCIASMSSF